MVPTTRGSFNQGVLQPGFLTSRGSFNQSLYTQGLLQTGVVTLRVLTSRDLLDCKTVGFFLKIGKALRKSLTRPLLL